MRLKTATQWRTPAVRLLLSAFFAVVCLISGSPDIRAQAVSASLASSQRPGRPATYLAKDSVHAALASDRRFVIKLRWDGSDPAILPGVPGIARQWLLLASPAIQPSAFCLQVCFTAFSATGPPRLG